MLLPLAGAGIGFGAIGLGALGLGALGLGALGLGALGLGALGLGALGLGATSLLGSGTRFIQRLSRHAPARAIVDTVAQPQPAIGRRCLRSDLEQRDIVMRLAARKARLVGPAGCHTTGPIPVKRGRRFEFTQR